MAVRFRNGGIETDNGFAPGAGGEYAFVAGDLTHGAAYNEDVAIPDGVSTLLIKAATFPSGTGSIFIGGITGGTPGREITIIREKLAGALFIQGDDDEDVTSVPANKSLNYGVVQDTANRVGVLKLAYSGSLSRWVVVAKYES